MITTPKEIKQRLFSYKWIFTEPLYIFNSCLLLENQEDNLVNNTNELIKEMHEVYIREVNFIETYNPEEVSNEDIELEIKNIKDHCDKKIKEYKFIAEIKTLIVRSEIERQKAGVSMSDWWNINLIEID